MRVVLDSGVVVDLGKVEITPTIGITDFSRRVTDAFGVTTIVPRKFTRRMAMRLAVPTERADAVYRQLTDLRATPALFIADDRFAWLQTRGIIKEFEFSFAAGDLANYSLSIDGLAESGGVTDTGIDPAASGRTSSFSLVQPITVNDAVLTSSSVAENDAPAWSSTVTYPIRTTVVRNHRIYESLVAGNVGADPATSAAKWLDTGPTNRWAMFDEALGSSTIASSPVEVVLKAGTAMTALAVLDTNAASVRVRAPGYDRTQVPNTAGQAIFLELAVPAGATVTVTLTPASANPGPQRWDDGAQWMDAGVWRDSLAAGDGTVTVGTFLVGEVKGLGVTEASPTAGIIDFSRKDVDEFGDVTIVQRSWSKKMAAKTLIRTNAVDIVADRLASVRARPCLWVGRAGTDSLTIYGFPKEWSIEIDQNVSKLSLSIEGLSKAAPIVPASSGSVAWPDITDPNGTKPTNNADKTSENTSKDTAAVGGRPTGDVLSVIDAAKARQDELENVTIPAINRAAEQAGIRIVSARGAADAAKARADAAFTEIEGQVDRLDERIDTISQTGGYDDTAIKAEVSRVDQAGIGRDAAMGRRVDTVSVSLTDTDRDIRALVQTKEEAAVGRENAISRRVDSIIAEGGGNDGVDSVARAELVRVEQASIDRDGAIATRVDTVQAAFTSGGGNLLTGTDFATLDGWVQTANLPGGIYGRNAAGAAYMAGGEDNLSFYQAGRDAGGDNAIMEVVSDPFAVAPSSFVQFYAFTASHRSRAWVSLYLYNAAGALVGYAGENSAARVDNGGRDPNAWDQTGLKSYQVPADAVTARMLLRKYNTFANAAPNDSYGWFWRPFVGIARAGQTSWNPYSPGSAKAVQVASTARVKETTDALARADVAFASKQTELEASSRADPTMMNGNATFSNWADARGTVPGGWGLAAASPGAVANRVTGVVGKYALETSWAGANNPASFYYAVSGLNFGDEYGGIDAGMFGGPGWYVMEADVTLISGSLAGSGFYCGAYNSNGVAVVIASADFGVTSANGGAAPGAGLPGARYKFAFLLDFNNPNTRSFRFHPMVAWDGFGASSPAKVLRWHKAGVRAATPSEIAAQRADTNADSALAKATAAESTLADLPNRYATAQRAATLEAQVNFAADSGLQRAINARIEDRATAIADSRTGAVAETVRVLRGEYDGTTAEVRDQRGVINGLNGKTAAYVRLIADAGGGRAALSLWSDQYGGAWSLSGDGLIDGNLTVNGSLTTLKVAPNAMTANVYSIRSGSFTTTAQSRFSVAITPATDTSKLYVDVAAIVTIGAAAAASTFATMRVYRNGNLIFEAVISRQRGVAVPFAFPLVIDAGAATQTVEVFLFANNGPGSGDPHIFDNGTIRIIEAKR